MGAQEKTQWAMNQSLLGVFFWEIGQDKSAERGVSLTEAAMLVANRTVEVVVKTKREKDEEERLLMRTAEHIGSIRERRRTKIAEKKVKEKKGREAAQKRAHGEL
jgi:GH18 family chitinase